MSDLVEGKGKDADFVAIAREIGSRADYVRNQYLVYRTYLQAKSLNIDTSRLENNFAVFFRALTGTRPISQFLGLPKDKTPSELRHPVPTKKTGALEEIIGYIHGTATTKPVIRDSRELAQLGQVLERKEALENLRLTRNLQRAYELAGGETRRLLDNLRSASYYLDESVKDIHRHTDDDNVKIVVERCIGTTLEIAKRFPELWESLKKQS